MVRSVEGIGWYYLEPEVLKKGERAESMLTLHTITTEIATSTSSKTFNKATIGAPGSSRVGWWERMEEKERCNNCKE